MNEKRDLKHLGARLRAERPAPRSGFVSAIVARVPDRVRQYPKASLRIALAAGITAALVAAVSAVGGVGYATHQVKQAVVAVQHVAFTKAPPRPPVPARSVPCSSCVQYGKNPPNIVKYQPKKSERCPTSVKIDGSNLAGVISVTVNGIPANFTVTNDHHIWVQIPKGAGLNPTVVVSNSTGSTSFQLKAKSPCVK
jgi:IPT/TIG domain-containing protein